MAAKTTHYSPRTTVEISEGTSAVPAIIIDFNDEDKRVAFKYHDMNVSIDRQTFRKMCREFLFVEEIRMRPEVSTATMTSVHSVEHLHKDDVDEDIPF